MLLTATEQAYIYFALTHLIEQFDEELLEQFRDSHLTTELSEQLEDKDSIDQIEFLTKKLNSLRDKIAQTPKTIQKIHEPKTKAERVLERFLSAPYQS